MVLAAPAPSVQPASPRPAAAPPAAPAAARAVAGLQRTAVAVVDGPSGDLDPVEEAVLLEVRSALRGRSSEEISRVVPTDSDRALATLVARGAVVVRGARYFPA